MLGLVAAMNYKHPELSADEFIEAVKSMQQALHIPDMVPPLKD
jgi:hypothetical protein